ncbi:hypothetical protein CLOSPO_02712 [Clostridium sporogenes ATCC 15579]|nr:hypothetical protein CLOSPO_02712 [Clostridium sporogenes ATCC 15579]
MVAKHLVCKVKPYRCEPIGLFILKIIDYIMYAIYLWKSV